ncbi:MAG: tetratricopeptide repeat protein [Myxococcales bacterium]|nr:tetratricopeptide repeat protein [Myxococcales bacterium]MDD9969782.1 tetratricopeptide repeat protein [Myxococcales bacterium]
MTRPTLLVSMLLLGSLLAACGGETETGSSLATSGGEDEADGMAKAVPVEPAPPRAATESGVTILQPDIDAVELSPDKGPPPPPDPNAPSKWGAPDAEAGKPLPKRRTMKGSAVNPYKQGLAQSRSGNDAAAKAAFEQALKADPRAFEAAYNLGVLADRAGQTNQALAYYRKALSIQPDYERAAEGIVRLHLRRRDVNSALRAVEPLAKRWVRNLHIQAIYAEVLVTADRLDQAEEVARKALRRDERSVPAMLALARSSLKRGRKELASSIIEQAKVVDENHPEIHFLLGQAYQEKGRLAEALTAYRKAIELRPEYAEARMALGIQYMAGGNYEQAVQQFEVAVRLVPMMLEAHLNLGDAYRAKKRWQDAKRQFDQALRMRDDLPEAHFNLGLLFMAAGGDFPQMDRLAALQRSILEFNNYRGKMGPRLRSNDPSEAYLADLTRQVEREHKRMEREKRAKERAARAKAMEKDGDE